MVIATADGSIHCEGAAAEVVTHHQGEVEHAIIGTGFPFDGAVLEIAAAVQEVAVNSCHGHELLHVARRGQRHHADAVLALAARIGDGHVRSRLGLVRNKTVGIGQCNGPMVNQVGEARLHGYRQGAAEHVARHGDRVVHAHGEIVGEFVAGRYRRRGRQHRQRKCHRCSQSFYPVHFIQWILGYWLGCGAASFSGGPH